jgi:hypothetical protein
MLVALVFYGNVVVKKREGREVGCLPRKAARLLDCYFQSPDSEIRDSIRTNRKKMDTLTDCALFYMSQIQVIRQVAIMPHRKLVHASGSWLKHAVFIPRF